MLALTEQHKKNISNALKGRKKTEEHKKKLSESLKGHECYKSKERSANISKFLKGKKHSEEANRRKSIRQTGRLCPEETKRKISEALIGHECYEDKTRKENISKALKGNSKVIKNAKKRWSNLDIDEKRKKMEPAIIANGRVNPSSLEIVIQKVLDDIGIKYETQKKVGIWFVDIYLPEMNLVIECNGNHWHNYDLFPDTKKRDQALQNHCDNKGIHLVWLWEKDITKDPEEALIKGLQNCEISRQLQFLSKGAE